LAPLREMWARAPSRAEIYFRCYTDSANDLHPFVGCLTEAEEAVCWKAQLMARRGGLVNWVKAGAILHNAGWTLLDDPGPDRR
jgi:hypothetical protein